MTRITATPQPHLIFNEFDRHGILLNLPRIEEEKNAEYKRRLLDVFVNRASSTPQGLINAVTRELGLSIDEVVRIVPRVDSNGDTLLPYPAVEFWETKCILYNNYKNNDILVSLDRFSQTGGAWTITQLITAINNTGYFTATLIGGADGSKRSMTIFNQSSVIDILDEDISGAGTVTVLENRNLLEGTVSVQADNLTRRVSSESAVVRSGDYYVKLKEGMLISRTAPAPGSFIKYTYRNDNFVAKASPVIIHNLQDTDFKNQMFEDTGSDDDVHYGAPTPLGADIINELMSVYPANWGA